MTTEGTVFSTLFMLDRGKDITSSRFMAIVQDCSLGSTAQLEEFWNQEHLHYPAQILLPTVVFPPSRTLFTVYWLESSVLTGGIIVFIKPNSLCILYLYSRNECGWKKYIWLSFYIQKERERGRQGGEREGEEREREMERSLMPSQYHKHKLQIDFNSCFNHFFPRIFSTLSTAFSQLIYFLVFH